MSSTDVVAVEPAENLFFYFLLLYIEFYFYLVQIEHKDNKYIEISPLWASRSLPTEQAITVTIRFYSDHIYTTTHLLCTLFHGKLWCQEVTPYERDNLQNPRRTLPGAPFRSPQYRSHAYSGFSPLPPSLHHLHHRRCAVLE